MIQNISETIEFLKTATRIKPKLAIILGSGLYGAVEELKEQTKIPYQQIPNFPVPTAPGHPGELVIGYLNDFPVMVMKGRFHYYEGYKGEEITFPIRVMRKLGVDRIIITNISGGINSLLREEDIVIIYDHINLMGRNPLEGYLEEIPPKRFPQMSTAYSREFIEIAEKAFIKAGIVPRFGVYAGVLGPSLETPAELRFLFSVGADLVGMSTVPEVIVAVQEGMKVLALSIVTNIVNLWHEKKEEKIIEVAKKGAEKLKKILPLIVQELAEWIK